MLLADDLGKKICEVMGLNVDQVERLIIDLQPRQPLRVYVKQFSGSEALTIDWSDLEDAEITFGAP